jgi:hypothetical protein
MPLESLSKDSFIPHSKDFEQALSREVYEKKILYQTQNFDQ